MIFPCIITSLHLDYNLFITPQPVLCIGKELPVTVIQMSEFFPSFFNLNLIEFRINYHIKIVQCSKGREGNYSKNLPSTVITLLTSSPLYS